MSTTIAARCPGASQPKEPMRLIDIKEVLQYDGAHFIWSGGKNCLTEQKAAYARGYNAGMKFIVDEAKKAPTIDPESMRPTAHWISDSGGSQNVVCSACNAISFAAYNFCPECGKRMVNTDEKHCT